MNLTALGLYVTFWPLHARGAASACFPCSLLPFFFLFSTHRHLEPFFPWLSGISPTSKKSLVSPSPSVLGLCLRHNRLTCGSILEASCGAVAAGEEPPISCAAEPSKYCFICTVTLGPCGDLPSASWGRWQCIRGGVDAGFNSFIPPAVAAQNIGVGPCRGGTCGDMLEAMTHIVPSQTNKAKARIAPHSPMVPMVKNKI